MRLSKSLFMAMLALVLSFGMNNTARADIELGKALKEIFVKGSLDGDKLFMVLGMEKAREIAGNAMGHAVDIEELKDWSSDSARMIQNGAHRLWNSEHNGDVVDHVGDAARLSVETA